MSGWVATIDNEGNEVGCVWLDAIEALDVVRFTPQHMEHYEEPVENPGLGPLAAAFAAPKLSWRMVDDGPTVWHVMATMPSGESRIVGLFDESQPAFDALAQLAEHVESSRTGVPMKPELPAEVVHRSLEELGPKSRVILRKVAELSNPIAPESVEWVDFAVLVHECPEATMPIIDRLAVAGWLKLHYSPDGPLGVPNAVALGPKYVGAPA